MAHDHWLSGFNFNVEEWDAKGLTYETLAICRTLALATAAFAAAIAEKPTGRFMIRSRTADVQKCARTLGTPLRHAATAFGGWRIRIIENRWRLAGRRAWRRCAGYVSRYCAGLAAQPRKDRERIAQAQAVTLVQGELVVTQLIRRRRAP